MTEEIEVRLKPAETGTGRRTWYPLNAIDLSAAACGTMITLVMVPLQERETEAVTEALDWIGMLCDRYRADCRDGGIRLRDMAEIPMPEGDPDDFPVDPLGCLLWPWRKQLWAHDWDAMVNLSTSKRGRIMTIAAMPVT